MNWESSQADTSLQANWWEPWSTTYHVPHQLVRSVNSIENPSKVAEVLAISCVAQHFS